MHGFYSPNVNSFFCNVILLEIPGCYEAPSKLIIMAHVAKLFELAPSSIICPTVMYENRSSIIVFCGQLHSECHAMQEVMYRGLSYSGPAGCLWNPHCRVEYKKQQTRTSIIQLRRTTLSTEQILSIEFKPR